jgi:polyhydroxybutyrate depolymerase
MALPRFLLALALLIAGTAASLASAPPPQGGPGKLLSGKVEVGGVTRTYLTYIPTGYRGGAIPMVFGFHGGGGYAIDMALASNLSREAEPANFIAVYPRGIEETWNTGGDGRAFTERSKADDVAMVRAILDQLGGIVAIDARRVYAVGFSKGAMFAYTAACALPGVFAAVAAVSGPMVTEACTPSSDASVLHIHGTIDQNVPFGGGRGAFTDPRNSWPPSLDGLKAWAARDKCGPSPASTPAPPAAPAWICSAYANCGGGNAVTWCLIPGGGHEWPAAAPAIIAAFLKAHAK